MLGLLDPFHGPVGPYNLKKDTSHLLLLTLAQRGYRIFYADPSSLSATREGLMVRSRRVTVLPTDPYFHFHEEETWAADRFSLIMMRKDPPVDQAYLYTTQLLSLVADQVPVINHPQALREWNEKTMILHFPRWIPPTLVTAHRGEIDRFVRRLGGVALAKPLDGFAGTGIALLRQGDPRTCFKTSFGRTGGPRETFGLRREASRQKFSEGTGPVKLTEEGQRPIMVQAFLPEISKGEKRVFMVNGAPLGALLKIPPEGSFIANPDHGARLTQTRLTTREKRICADLSPFLKKNGIFFAGIDLIDERLIEINITSPGLLWEWNEVDNVHHEDEIVDLIERKLK